MVNWYVWMIMAVLFFAGHNLLRKKILKKEHATEYLTVFGIFVFLLILPFFKLVNFHQPMITWMLFYTDALILTGSFIFLSKAYRHLDVSEVAPLTNMNIIFILIIGLTFLNEVLTSHHIVGVLLILIGAYVLEADPHFKDIWKPLRLMKSKYVQDILLGILFMAISIILGKILLSPSQVNLNIPPVAPFTLVFITRMFLCINFLIILLVFFDGFKGIGHGVKSAGWLILLGAGIFISGSIMFYVAMSMTFLTLVFAFSKVETLITTLIGGRLFHEKALMQKVLASVVIIAGAILVVL